MRNSAHRIASRGATSTRRVRSSPWTALLCTAALGLPVAASATGTGTTDALARATGGFAERVVIPAHERLSAAARRLDEAAAAFVDAPHVTTLAAVRQAWLRTAVAHAGLRAFAFGPVHSLGHDVALAFPTDEAGVERLIAGLGEASVAEIDERRLTPSLTGLETIDHVLRASDDPGDFAAPTRRYLAALTRRVDRVSAELLDVWRKGHDGHPPFATVLGSAGAPDNRAYLSVEGAAEEIVRALVDTLEVVVHEDLPELIERADALGTDADAASLAMLGGTLDGVSAAYRGARIGDWFAVGAASPDVSIRRALDEATEALADAVAEPWKTAAALTRAATALEPVPALLESRSLALRASAEHPLAAGPATVHLRSSGAYEAAPPNLTAQGIEDHELGDQAFEESFVLTIDHASAGLGPIFNNTSCVGCHVRNGRGMPVPGQLLLRVSDALPGGARAAGDESDTLEVRGNTPPVAGIGNQVQDFAVVGETPEALVRIDWSEVTGTYPDGQPWSVRRPRFEVTVASTGKLLPEAVHVSPRVPPHVYGLGLLEAIPEADILALADPDDRDGDGISGRPNHVWNERRQGRSVGRFGWKANSPNLLQQTADAYLNDMGIHSPMFPADDGSSEIDEATLVAATAYSQTLAVPARRATNDPIVRRGETLFAEAGCSACHVDTFVTGDHKYPALRDQVIHPYTDLLLHDMGEGLADGRPDFEASGREWRTASLWGIGLAQTVLPYSGYLHDGRARTFEEAILWHGGEAAVARATFERLPAEDRRAMVRFLRSL